MTIKELIKKNGGATKFAQRFGISRRTVEAWSQGRRDTPEWVLALLTFADEHGYSKTK